MFLSVFLKLIAYLPKQGGVAGVGEAVHGLPVDGGGGISCAGGWSASVDRVCRGMSCMCQMAKSQYHMLPQSLTNRIVREAVAKTVQWVFFEIAKFKI
ncbi:MAG: hypothetical protein ACI9FZ_000247 [Bacteroidia bacterium]